MLTCVWASKLSTSDRPVLVNACHPGEPCTKLSRALGYNLSASKDCSRAAVLPVFLALDPQIERSGWTGQWFHGSLKAPAKCRFAASALAQQRLRLFEICEQFSSGKIFRASITKETDAPSATAESSAAQKMTVSKYKR